MSDAGPRLGFLGLGWIGQHRMRALLESGARVAALCDADPTALDKARELAPAARRVASFDALLREPLDGVVIATPSALHAEQSLRALEHGLPVFCQKPLGRNAAEVARVVEAARRSDRLLGVDFSYRYTAAMQRVAALVRSGELGRIYAAQLVFHNAYGPDKPWFYDATLSGGGALMDLGSHLVDLALWVLGFPALRGATGQLYAQARPLATGDGRPVEDYVTAQLAFEGGVAVDLQCSWKLHAGCDCVIEASFFGERGAACLRNVGGSFYDFSAEAFSGTARRVLASPPDAWGGRAAQAWAARLARSARYDAAADELVQVARVLDVIYAAAPPARVEDVCES
ncbi:MAG TPA: Gfo/Idh/MocA family oxidoreductase [Polyangiales bacterium]|nr:Gfo/Idh/MocA family oxidoreductase [Polyangiales bacterium]